MQIETKFNLGEKAIAMMVVDREVKAVEITIERINIVVNANGMMPCYEWSDDDGRAYKLPECALYSSEEEYQQQKKYKQRNIWKKELINVAEILKNCQAGIKLDCVCFENVVFDRVDDKNRIRCFVGSQRDEVSFNKYGCLNSCPSAKCVIFPMGKTTWEELQRPFKDGDIVATKNGLYIGIVKVEDCVPYETYCAIDRSYEKVED